MKIGIVPLTWGQFREKEPNAWPQERILREVKEAGFDAVSSFPRRNQRPEEHAKYLAEFGLKAAPGYFQGDFWLLDKQAEYVEAARRQAATSAALGLTELFVAPAGWDYVSRSSDKKRSQIGGHVGPDDGLSDDEWRAMAETLNAIGAATQAEGVFTCIHNHIGQVVETPAECDRLMGEVDQSVVFWGPDLGHLTWAGGDAVEFTRKYARQIKSLHLKDVVRSVREQAFVEEWEPWKAVQSGVWTELGQGEVDFSAVFQILRENGYFGWILSEIDVTQKPSALQSARECRDYLKSQGL